MRIKWIIAVGAIIAVVAWYLLRAPGDQLSQGELDQLIRRQNQQRSQPARVDVKSEPDWARLAESKMGQPVPPSLVAKPDPSGDFWFVGKPGHDVAVEIPFAPGRFPADPPNDPPLAENPGFLGADACQSCHQEKYDSFIHTAHHLTSRVADVESIAGSLEPGENQLPTRYADIDFEMVARGMKAFQRVSFFDWQFEVPIDLIIGSSKMAETYLYWHRDQLFQMNVSYLTSHGNWINSPGYIDGDAAYARPIPARCLDCHLTYADYRSPPNHYTADSLILGISCERCHGPGQQHVQYHQANPKATKGQATKDQATKDQFVAVPSKLSRQQQLDICGQCHSTVTAPKGAPFAFRPGDTLAQHYEAPDPDKDGSSVHTSNQLARLSLSECFIQSDMACVECHNPHKKERGEMALFSSRCMECHSEQSCGLTGHDELNLADNCIDCHMPKTQTENLRLSTSQGDVFPPLRDHYIRVSPAATAEFLQK